MIFLMSSWKIKLKKIVCNYFFLVFTSLHADPDPYEQKSIIKKFKKVINMFGSLNVCLSLGLDLI